MGHLRARGPFRTVHVATLALCAVMLPWSTAFLSMAQMLLVANWLAEGVVRKDLGSRLRIGLMSAAAFVFLSFFLLHVVGLFCTTDMKWGVDLVRILLPIISFTPVLASSHRLSVAEFRAVLLLGAWSVVTSTFVCLLIRTGDATDYRSLSVFISHIRLTLLLCLAVVILFFEKTPALWLRVAGYLAAAWAIFFINKLASIQGFFILAVLVWVFLWRWVGSLPVLGRWAVRSVLVFLPMLAVIIGVQEIRQRYRLPDPALATSTETSASGDHYEHNLTDPQTENGTHVWTFLSWREIYVTWAARSERPINSLDDKGNPIRSTLARYLASKGERKDSLSIMALSEDEVHAIERGVTNVDQGKRSKLRERFEEVVFELEHYYAYGAADGHSVAMRMEFLKAGAAIAKRNWLYGVGTGDTQLAFDEQYERMNSSLAKEWRHRAHNEYLTLWISFGVFGMLWALFSWWWPAWKMGAWVNGYFIAWAIIFGISCLSDDTIETQAGATFLGLYYALFVFAAPRQGT